MIRRTFTALASLGLAFVALLVTMAAATRLPPAAALAIVPSHWTVQTVDSPNAGPGASMRLDSQGRPHVSYFDQGLGVLKYAVLSGTQWMTEVVDSRNQTGAETSLVLDASDRPAVAYLGNVNLNVRYAARISPTWVFSDVDQTGSGPGGQGFSRPALAFDGQGRPHIVYFNFTTLRLMHAYREGGTWLKEAIARVGNLSMLGAAPSLVISGQAPHLAFLSESPDPLSSTQVVTRLYYATLSGTQWVTAVVADSPEAAYTAIALDAQGRPSIAYNEPGAGLRYAVLSGTVWLSETIDRIGDPGEYVSLVFDTDGIPHVGYLADTGGGKARYAYKLGPTWLVQTVTTARPVRGYTAVAVDAAGDPHMAYYTLSVTRTLEYAYVKTRHMYLPVVLKSQ
ncbi:MAG TPA: hypothetical protein VFL17_07700 [Anaerolineae bacterium]|nr:hypothetical protein [Anaerolineae bacterium]